MEEVLDSTNNSDEWIVDGDLYLINMISRYPILWDRKHFDSEMRNEVWLKLSNKLKIKLEWMKKRWSYLREQYVRHLKQLNNLEPVKPSKKTYKYFNEMSFLADHIQIRNCNFKDAIKSSNLQATSRLESDELIEAEKDDILDSENENFDFVITENEIEAYNDDDDLSDNLFVELSDEEKDEQSHENDEYSPIMDSKPPKLVTLNPPPPARQYESKPNTLTKPIKRSTVAFEVVQKQITEPSAPADRTTTCRGNEQMESRCEDVIFGELVTSMLKKMDSPNRKRAKKEILNILLS